jgi:uncharacterized protein (DUF433 family)
MDYLQHFARSNDVCGGEPTILGTRVTLRVLLASLAAGDADEDILRDYPAVTREDLRAVIAFAAASAGEDMPNLGTPPEFGGAMAILQHLDDSPPPPPAAE